MDETLRKELARACMLGDLETMIFLFEMQGEDACWDQDIIDQTIGFEFGVFEGTALMEAAYYNNPKIVWYLVHAGADVDKQTEYGETALMSAAREGHLSMVDLLIGIGADPNIQDDQGTTALMIALSVGHMHIVEYLCDHGADINISNYSGSTAILMAAYKGNLNAAKSFAGRGAIITNDYDESKITTLAGKLIKDQIAEFFKSVASNLY